MSTPPATPAAPTRPVRAACIDDDTLIREGVARLLPGLEVVGAYDQVERFLQDAPDVDVVLLDLWLRHEDDAHETDDAREPRTPTGQAHGAEGVAVVADAGYRVLIYTTERRREVLAGCLAAGAHGVVHKSERLDAVVDAAERVAAGEVVITTALAGLAEVVERHGGMPTLSPRQLDVLKGRARGETYKSIAARLYISPKTAEEYMGEVNRRFADYLRSHSPADLERHLGVGDGDLLDRG